ncbi:hypothetical protein DRO97_06520 [Archaeoglobales archaeon]|nr:MAG: hypothetical protein DRO97_06520 [Archaeoglobales archaeon]
MKLHSKAEFLIETENPEIIYNSLRIDYNEVRSKAKLYLAKDRLLLRIEAEDLTALRAAINAWLRLIRMCEEVLEVLE